MKGSLILGVILVIIGTAAANVGPDGKSDAETVRRVNVQRRDDGAALATRGTDPNFLGDCEAHQALIQGEQCNLLSHGVCTFYTSVKCGWGKQRYFYNGCNGPKPSRNCDFDCYKPCLDDTPLSSCDDIDTTGCVLSLKAPCSSACGVGHMIWKYTCDGFFNYKTCRLPCCCKHCPGSGGPPPAIPCAGNVLIPPQHRFICCPATIFP